jgi:hypothetical protein
MITGSGYVSTKKIALSSSAVPPSSTHAAVHLATTTAATAVLLAILGGGGWAAWAAGTSTATPPRSSQDPDEKDRLPPLAGCDPAPPGPGSSIGGSLVDSHRLRHGCHGAAEAHRAVQPCGPRAAAFFSFTRPPAVAFCEGGASQRPSTTTSTDEAQQEDGNKPGRTDAAARIPTTTTLSWWHRALYRLSIRPGLPLPRRVGRNDPDLVLTRRQRNQRQRDEKRARALQQRLVQLVQQKQKRQQHQSTLAQNELDAPIAQLVQELYAVLYGEGVTPQSRQEFLERHGCTGWTDHAMDAILRKAMRSDGKEKDANDAKSQRMPRGVVEIGPGHGQWARQIADRYRRRSATGPAPSKPFDIVLAYDDGSSLPLNSAVYHRHTKPHHDFFYDRVQSCPSIQSVLSQWQCRGRILLLVYPPPDSNMARDALEAYVAVDDANNDTVLYVGEGRGGANANDAFFDLLESGQWVLEEIVNVRPMGSKGYERMYVLARSQSAERHD